MTVLDDLRVRLARAARLVAVELDGETVIFDPEDEGLHLLDPVASVIWSALDGEMPLDELCAALAAEFGAPAAQVRGDVGSLVQELLDKDLVVVREGW
jgi:hypothetical protein